jgi:Protein of unknown function/AsmA-like C-terminal region
VRRALALVLRLLLGLTVVGSFALALLAARLASGPVSLDRLTPYLEEALAASGGDYHVAVGAADLAWGGWDEAFEIRLRQVAVTSATGERLLSFDHLATDLSAEALLRGRVAPTRIRLDRPHVTVLHTEDGRFVLLGGQQGAADEADRRPLLDRLTFLLARLARPQGVGPAQFLAAVSVRGATVDFRDEAGGVGFRVADVDADLARLATGLRLTGAARAELSPNHVRLAVSGTYRDGRAALAVTFGEAVPAALAPLAEATLHADLGRWIAGLRVPIRGTVRLAMAENANLSSVAFDVSGGGGEVSAPRFWPAPVAVAAFSARGELSDGFTALELEELALDAEGATLQLRGVADWSHGLRLRGEGEVAEANAESLERLWPLPLLRGARKWVTENILDGTVRSAHIRGNLKPGDLRPGALPADALSGSFAFDGVTVRYARDLQPIVGGRGTATFTGRQLDVSVSEGRLEGATIREGHVRLTNLGQKGEETATIEGKAEAPVRDALTILAQPRLGFPQRLGLDPERAAGSATADLAFRFPLKKGLQFADDVAWEAHAVLDDAALPRVPGGFAVSDGDVTLDADPGGLALRGTAELNGVPLDIAWYENFEREAGEARRYGIEGLLTPDARRRLGIPDIRFVAGPVFADLEVSEPRQEPGERRYTLGLDLTRAAVELPVLAWRKGAGQAAELRLEGWARGEELVIAPFTVSAPDLAASGRARLTTDDPSRLRELELTRLQVGRTDLRVQVRERPGGGLRVDLSGAGLDLTRHLAGRGQGGGGFPALPRPDFPSLAVELSVARVTLGEGRQLDDVSGQLLYASQAWREGNLRARLPTGAIAAARLAPEADADALTVSADDAGALLAVLGAGDAVRGGQLRLTARLPKAPAEPDATGRLVMTDYMVVNAPLLARLLTFASAEGLSNLLAGEGIRFIRLEAPFRISDGTISIDNARIHGSELGLTAEGTIDLAADALDLSGTIAPIYTLNTLLSRVPLVGNLLAGGKDEAVFAFTYSITGSRDDPVIFVNPLSVLTPGFLRNLFGDGFRSGAAPADDGNRPSERILRGLEDAVRR